GSRTSEKLDKQERGQARKQSRDTGPGWVRFTSANRRKVGQFLIGVDTNALTASSNDRQTFVQVGVRHEF
ncbi:MAG TPA: hypothetical protein VJS30_25565, partial [Paraburkholderia sp.]|nr:hypothetical protein [Paraburkholderia sp.]